MALLVKFCERRDYANDLLDGRLHCNRVRCIQKLDNASLRGDRDEGAILLGRSVDEVQVFMRLEQPGEEWQQLEGLAEVPRLRYDPIPDLNLFCMSVFQTPYEGEPTSEIVDRIRQMIVDSLPMCSKLGGHAVVISDSREFVRRVRAASDEAGYQHWHHLVDYYDEFPADYHSWEQGSVKPLFLKHREFELQREVRLVLDTGTRGENHISLNIGDIRDIAIYVPTASLAGISVRNGELGVLYTPKQQVEAMNEEETMEAVKLLLYRMCNDCPDTADMIYHLLDQLCDPCLRDFAPKLGLVVADTPDTTSTEENPAPQD
ncbi:MAG: hypothetical protein OXU74_17120 [Gemmatimonadota bacterium]|nr:hypothetical protein [Gemmatimonadota bacterium]